MNAAKPSTVMDTILDSYSNRIHEALQTRFKKIESEWVRRCYLRMTDVLFTIHQRRISRSNLHPTTCRIIAETTQLMKGKSLDEDPMLQQNLEYHVTTIHSKLYHFFQEIKNQV